MIQGKFEIDFSQPAHSVYTQESLEKDEDDVTRSARGKGAATPEKDTFATQGTELRKRQRQRKAWRLRRRTRWEECKAREERRRTTDGHVATAQAEAGVPTSPRDFSSERLSRMQLEAGIKT